MTVPFLAPGQHLQRTKRALREFKDNHGRMFQAWSDIATSQPVEELRPMGFAPPWLPPMRFAKFRQDGDLVFRWDYDSMANDLAGVTQEYYQHAIMFAINNKKPEPEVGGPVDPAICIAMGNPPLSPAIPLSAKAGEPWILGVPGAPVNEVLKEILHQGIGSTNRTALDIIRKSLAARLEGITRVPEIAVPVHEGPSRERTIHDVEDMDVSALLNVSFHQFAKQYAAAAHRKGEKADAGEIGRAWKDHKAALAEISSETAA